MADLGTVEACAKLLLDYELTEKDIETYMGKAKQGFRFGKRMAASGDVRGLTLEVKQGVIYATATVHSHVFADLWYKNVTVQLGEKIMASDCNCEGSKLPSIHCKHICALLFGLFLLKHHSDKESPPAGFKRPNMTRYQNLSDNVKKRVKFDLSWPQLISELLIDAEVQRVGRTNKDRFQTAKKTGKPKPKHPATLEATPVVELKKILAGLGLEQKGTKAVLIQRIVQHRPIPPSVAPSTVTKGTLKKAAPTPKSTKQVISPQVSQRKRRADRELEELAADRDRFLKQRKLR